MAIQTKTLSSAEHDWFATRSGLPVNTPLSDHKMKYFSDKGFGSNASIHKPISQMEEEWLSSLTGVTSGFYADKWLQAVAGQGLVPTQRLSENQFTFYSQVTSSP